MNKGFVVAVTLILTACNNSVSDMSMFQKRAPKAIAGDDSQIVLYDPLGVDAESGQKVATKYCAGFGKSVDSQSRGGPDDECVSSQMDYCMTYTCK